MSDVGDQNAQGALKRAMTEQKTCFVVGPIGEAGSAVRQKADWLLKGVIKPVLEADQLGYKVKRADDDADPGSISNALINDVIHSDLVVADLTGFNPNAFYELGIRHAVQKPTIHIIAEAVRLPFDNLDQRTIFIDLSDYGSFESARQQLQAAAQAVGKAGYTVTNPVTRAGGIALLQESADPKDQIIGDVLERISRLEQEKTASAIVGQGPFATISEDEAERRLLRRIDATLERGSLVSQLARIGSSSNLVYMDKVSSKANDDLTRASGLLERYLNAKAAETAVPTSHAVDGMNG